MRERFTEFDQSLRFNGSASIWNFESLSGLHAIQRMVFDEAQMVAFLNDFVFLVFVAFLAMPLCFLLRRPESKAG